MEPWLVVIPILLLALVIAYANLQNARPFRFEASTTLEPAEALDTLQARLARDGWSLGLRDADNLVMNASRNADLGSTAAIGCLSVWLGLLYALSSRRTITVDIHVERTANGTVVTINGSRSGNGALRYIAERLRELPKS
jgi:hypothetical protein